MGESHISVILELDCLAPLQSLKINIHIPNNSNYPYEPPYIHFTHKHLTKSHIMQIIQNSLLDIKNNELVGEQMCFTMLSYIETNLSDIINNPTGFPFLTLVGEWWKPKGVVKKEPEKREKTPQKSENEKHIFSLF